MATLREKVTGGPLGKKSPMRVIVGTAGTEKPIGPEGKTLTPAQQPVRKPVVPSNTTAVGRRVLEYQAAARAKK